MASKRMISKAVIERDDFIGLSKEAKLLYFILSLYADKHGFTGMPKSIARMHALDDKALDELVNSHYIKKNRHGVIVAKRNKHAISERVQLLER